MATAFVLAAGTACTTSTPSGSTIGLDDPSGWSQYVIPTGSHAANVVGGYGNPVQGFTNVDRRHFRFIFDESAEYTITEPVQPGDQFDYNKLPGFSDCGTTDLSQYGAMFGWRWRLDTTPRRLEVVQYANLGGVHTYPDTPLFTLSHDEIASHTPLDYRISIDGASYRFEVQGEVLGRQIFADVTLPRGCGVGPTDLKWASGLYFGGTSVAPQQVTGRMFEF